MTPIPIPADERREAIARIIDPSKWRVLDSYLEQVKRISTHVTDNVVRIGTEPDAGYDPDQFKDKASLAKADAILASEPAREEAPSLLWCCHVRGPDDVIPAPDYTTALKLADAVNAAETGPDRLLRAVPALWPWSAESHAAGLAAAPPMPADLKDAIARVDEEIGKLPMPLGYEDWTYRDLPWMLDKFWVELFEIIGSGNFKILAMTKMRREGDPCTRGQIWLSPAGYANLVKHNAKQRGLHAG